MADATIQQSGGDFTSINAFVGDAGTSATDTGTISGTWSVDDTAAVTWNKAVIIVATGSSKQTGNPWQSGDTTYRHRVTSGHAFTVTAAVDISDINIQSDSTGVSDEIFRAAGAVGGTVTNCILGFTGNTDEQDVWYTEDCTTKTVTFDQCIFYDVGRSIVDFVTGGQNGTFTIEFNSCASLNIGADGGRGAGCWVGDSVTDASDTVAVDAHNCLINVSDTYAFGSAFGNPSLTLTCTYSLCNIASGALSNQYDTETSTGSEFSYTWVEAVTASGSEVGMTEITALPYDFTLIDDDTDNEAMSFHSTVTGAGLTIPDLDITGKTRDKTTPSFDVGPHTNTVAAAGGGGPRGPLGHPVHGAFGGPVG